MLLKDKEENTFFFLQKKEALCKVITKYYNLVFRYDLKILMCNPIGTERKLPVGS